MFGLFKRKKEESKESKNSENKKELEKKAVKDKATLRKDKDNSHKEKLNLRKKERSDYKENNLNNESKDNGREKDEKKALPQKTKKDIVLKQDLDNKKQKNINNNLSSNYQAVMTVKKDNLQKFILNNHKKFIDNMQRKLLSVTRLKPLEQEAFEELYKIAYSISHSRKIPKWLSLYDLLFVGEGHAVILSKFNTSAGPLLSIEEIMKASLRLDSLTAIFFKLEFIINQMIKMYNDGKNRNYHFKDSIRDLKQLGLVEKDLYEKLLFIAEIRSKIGRAWNVGEVKFQNPEGKFVKLKEKEIEFKALFSEIYTSIIEIYIKVQEPYLNKFYLLWEQDKLNIGYADNFYLI